MNAGRGSFVEKATQAFGGLLEELRKQQGISKKQLAELARLSPSYISLLTRGERGTPSEETVAALSQALQLDTDARARLFAAAGYLPPNGLGPPDSASLADEWGDAPDVSTFYGREDELQQLETWIVQDRCRLVAILGMGGMGKSALTTRLAHRIQQDFRLVIWRSLVQAPPVTSILSDYLRILARTEGEQPTVQATDDMLVQLLHCLQRSRYLLVLDNMETVLPQRKDDPDEQERWKGYSRLLELLGSKHHKSCLVVTSREKPREIAVLEGARALSSVRSLLLAGLSPQEGREILKDKGLHGEEEVWDELIACYSGNPLALKMVSEVIREVFSGNIRLFLKHGQKMFSDISEVLREQFERLTDLEQRVMYWLAIEREAMSTKHLYDNMTAVKTVVWGDIQEALQALQRKSLIEVRPEGFVLPNVVLEYTTERLIEQLYAELETNRIIEWFAKAEDTTESMPLFVSHALSREQKDHIRELQIQFVFRPLRKKLRAILSRVSVEAKIAELLDYLRAAPFYQHRPGYVARNLFELLVQLPADVRGYDFSRLKLRRSNMQGVDLRGVHFAGADLTSSVFTEIFDSVLTVAFSPNGQLLAAGSVDGGIRLWQKITDERQLRHTGVPWKQWTVLEGHTGWVRSVAFSPGGDVLASGSDDQTIRLWSVLTRADLPPLVGHQDLVMAVAFSPDGNVLASGSSDRTIRLWQVERSARTYAHLHTLEGHTDRVRAVAFSPDGRLLASASDDETVRLWDVATGQPVRDPLGGHSKKVWTVAFHPAGNMLATGSGDYTVRLWDVATGECLAVLAGHGDSVLSVAFSPDGALLVSGGADNALRFWDVATRECTHWLADHTNRVWAVAFNPQRDEQTQDRELASCSDDKTVRLWSIKKKTCLHTFEGYTSAVLSVAFSPDGALLASGSSDRKVRLWHVADGQERLEPVPEHANRVRAVAFSPDGSLLASGGDDNRVRLWDIQTGNAPVELTGHSSWVRAIAFSPDGTLLASASDDQTVRLWDVRTGYLVLTLIEHTSWVRAVAFSPTGDWLASGGDDQTVRLWDVRTGECRHTLHGHIGLVHGVACSPDGRLLASASADATIRIWDSGTGECVHTLHGHTNRVMAVAFSPDGTLLASGSADRTVRLWDVQRGARQGEPLMGHMGAVMAVAFNPQDGSLASGSEDESIRVWEMESCTLRKVLRVERPYTGMNIAGVTGLTPVQIKMLRELGAVEEA